MTDLVEQHRDEVHKIAIKIDRLITDSPQAKSHFTEYINRFCKMVEDFGQALQPYEMPFRKALEKIRKAPKFRNMTEYKIFCEARKRCPLPKNWIEIPWQDTKFIKVGDYLPAQFIKCNAQPQNVVNPTVWFELEPQLITRQKAPTEDEKLMCEYVLLGVVHDRMIRTPTEKLFPISVGKWFDRLGFYDKVSEIFCNIKHAMLTMGNESKTPTEVQELRETFRERQLRLNLALKRVKAKLDASKKPENPYDDFLQDIAYIFPRYPFRQGQKYAHNDILVSRKELDELQRLVEKGIKKSLTEEEHKRFVQLYKKMPGAERLTNDEIQLIRQLVGSFDMDYIGDFLIRNCHVLPSELNNISWPTILKRLKSLRHSLRQEKKLQADPTGERKKEEMIVLTQNQRKILKYLKEINTAVAQVDIESQTGLSNKTVSAELRILKEYNFVAPPKGKARRIVITQRGVNSLM